MNLLLINPPYKKSKGFNREGRCTQKASFWSTPWPPYSLTSLAAVLREEHDVKVLDCPPQNIDAKKLISRIDENRPDILIAPICTQTVEEDLSLFGSIKKQFQTRIIIFGIHASYFAEYILKSHPIDFIVRHEPEATMKELITVIERGSDLSAVKGIAYRSDYKICITEERDYLEDLDSLPFPAWDLVNLDNYKLPLYGRSFIIINSIRGCPFRCSFCNAQVYYGSKVRARSVQNILREIRFSIKKYKIKDIFFWGDTFTLLRPQIKGLCQSLIDEQLGIHWVANSRVDTVDKEILSIMKKAGCWMISYGIESGNDGILKRSGKNITLKQIKEAIEMTRAAGIKTIGHFILGLPGENETTAKETITLAKSLRLDFVNFYAAIPFPGSRLYVEALQSGWLKDACWEKFSQSKFVMDLPNISKKRLRQLRRNAYYSFYTRPKNMRMAMSMIFTKSGISGIVRLIKSIWKRNQK